jgi:amiloride-sensitive sodium channel
MSQHLKKTFDDAVFPGLESINNRWIAPVLRLSWITAFILSISGLTFYVHGVYIKWHIEPDISTTIRQISSSEIPFPAITLCQPTLPDEIFLEVNPMFFIYRVKTKQISPTLTITEQNYMAAIMQSCFPEDDVKLVQEMCPDRSETNVVKLLMNGTYGSQFYNCEFRDSHTPHCGKLLRKSLTEFGICQTYNMQSFQTIFNERVLSTDFDFYRTNSLVKFPYFKSPLFTQIHSENDSVEWTLESGYRTKDNEVLPIRALKRNRVSFRYQTTDENIYICPKNGRGLQLMFHLPNESPTFFSDRNFVAFNHDKKLSVTAKIYTTSPEMRSYPPKIRRCYYEGEKKLKFFKTYTKNLCDFECLTNYTLRQCGCVKFSMPRSESTKVCDLDKLRCLNNAINLWPNVDSKEALNDASATCNCLEACTNIRYSMTTERTNPMDAYKYEHKCHEF